jgi:hypothetical protein
MPEAPPHMLIFIQRSRAPHKDDRISIFPSLDNPGKFVVRYLDGESPSVGIRRMLLSAGDVQAYLEGVFENLAVDVDPFEFVQIAFPASPSIQYRISDLKSVKIRASIRKAIFLALEHWPVVDPGTRYTWKACLEDLEESSFFTPSRAPSRS